MPQPEIIMAEQAPIELLERLACLHVNAFKQLGQKGWKANQIASSLDQAGARLAYETAGGQIAGFALYKIVLDEAELFTLAVDPAWQRAGTASRLLGAIRQHLKKVGVASLFLEVRCDNVGAIACYEKLGFEQSGLRKNYYTDDSGMKVDASIFRLLP